MAASFAPVRMPRHVGSGQFRSPAIYQVRRRIALESISVPMSRPDRSCVVSKKPRLSLLQGGGDGVQTAAGLEVMGRGFCRGRSNQTTVWEHIRFSVSRSDVDKGPMLRVLRGKRAAVALLSSW